MISSVIRFIFNAFLLGVFVDCRYSPLTAATSASVVMPKCAAVRLIDFLPLLPVHIALQDTPLERRNLTEVGETVH